MDYPEKAGADKVNVLKFNLNKRFVTGIYDYALMQSVFTPTNRAQHPRTLRVTTSNIEWCGQFLTSTRLNRKGYEVAYQSYFDGEEEKQVQLPHAVLEDEIWNIIRIDPEDLPTGEVSMVPSILTQELTHQELKIENATCQVTKLPNGSSRYDIDYPAISRRLIIDFETAFPHRILAWGETFRTVAGWGMESKVMTTKAKRKETTLLDYWDKKYLRHEPLREELLGIED